MRSKSAILKRAKIACFFFVAVVAASYFFPESELGHNSNILVAAAFVLVMAYATSGMVAEEAAHEIDRLNSDIAALTARLEALEGKRVTTE